VTRIAGKRHCGARGDGLPDRPEGGERGAILVQVALALTVLLGFCGLVIDYGVWSVARAQAQNAADAGALAGATALAFDEVEDTTLAQQYAVQTARSTLVWGQAPVVNVLQDDVSEEQEDGSLVLVQASDFQFSDACQISGLPPPPPSNREPSCVTVHVYRDADHQNEIPTYLGRLFNAPTQGVRAQATAAVAPANVARCVWPLAIPDTWRDSLAIPPDTFSRYLVNPGPPTVLAGGDTYTPPSSRGDSSGYQLADRAPSADFLLTLSALLTGPEIATPGHPWPAVDKTHFVAVRLPGGSFASDLTTCNQTPIYLGDTLALDTVATWAGATAGATNRIDQDTDAHWESANRRIAASCAASNGCHSRTLISPRLVLLPVFDPDEYDRTRGGAAGTGQPTIKIVNFVGFFISVGDTKIEGNLTTYPGGVDTSHAFVPEFRFAFLRTAVLMR
jgi:hypothetical protein